MGTVNKIGGSRLLDPANSTLSGQAKVNAEIFTAVEILGRKLVQAEEERDRLARRLALMESAASVDAQTGKLYLPVALGTDASAAPTPSAPRWMIAVTLMSVVVALFALGAVLLRPPAPALTQDQVALLESLRGLQTAPLAAPDAGWKKLAPETQPLPDTDELAALEKSAEAPQSLEPDAAPLALDAPPPVAAAPVPLKPVLPPKAAETVVAKPAEAPVVKTAEKPPAPKAEKASEKAKVPEKERAEALPAQPAADPLLPPKAAELEQRAQAGQAEAQHDLATLYAAGKIVPQDYGLARTWFARAAEGGIANASYNLGVMNQQGLGGPPDLAQALSWYEKAADQGHPEAMYNLGIAYIQGVGVKADTEKGVDYFRRAARAGVAQAAYNLGVLYESNFIGPIDLKKAAEWYRAAAKQGHKEAQDALARLQGGTAAATTAGDLTLPPVPRP